MRPLLTSKKVKDKNCFKALKLCHPLTIKLNLFKQIIKPFVKCLTKSK